MGITSASKGVRQGKVINSQGTAAQLAATGYPLQLQLRLVQTATQRAGKRLHQVGDMAAFT